MKTAIPIVALLLCATSARAEELGAKRAEALKSNVKTFRLELGYQGNENKPFYRLTLSAPPVEHTNVFYRRVQIDEDQALRIIDHLAKSGSLDRAHKTGELEKLPRTCYLLTVQAGDLDVTEILGWDLAMLRQLDGLCSVLSDEAAKSMDLLVGRLSGFRGVWEKEADVSASFDTTVGRENSQVRFVSEGDSIVAHVSSEFGIDKATITRKAKEWQQPMILRLHLTGMESLKIGNGRETVNLRVLSTGNHRTFISLSRGSGESPIGRGFPHWTKAQIVGSEWKIPLKHGYFEVPLPAGLFKKNPRKITLEWVDFYRN